MLQLPSDSRHRRSGETTTKIAVAFRKLESLHYKMTKSYQEKNTPAANRYLARSIDAAEQIISMPAEGPSDMLLKIEAAGVLVDSTDSLGPIKGWQADLQGGICDFAAAKLLMTLREDIYRIAGSPES